MAKQKKIWELMLDFIKRNKEGALIGGGLAAVFAFFQPLYLLAIVAFSYFTPFGWDYMHSKIFRYVLIAFGVFVGAFIDQLVSRRKR